MTTAVLIVIAAVVVLGILALTFSRRRLADQRRHRHVEARARRSEAQRLDHTAAETRDRADRAAQVAAAEREKADDHARRARRAEKEAEALRTAAEEAGQEAQDHQQRAAQIDPDR